MEVVVGHTSCDLVREVREASLGHSLVEIMGHDLQGPVGGRLVPSLVAFVAVGHVSAAYPSLLVVFATFLLPVAARRGGLACQPALRRLPHTGPNGRRHHQLRRSRAVGKWKHMCHCFFGDTALPTAANEKIAMSKRTFKIQARLP